MKVLLDHCVPRRFGRLLNGHQIRTAFEMGWSGMRNGVLLAEARPQFDAFLTVDQNFQYQQNLATLPMPVAIIVAPDNRLETLAPYSPAVLDWPGHPLVCELVRIESPTQVIRVPARPSQS